MASQPTVAQNPATPRAVRPGRGFKSLSARMYLQIFAAVLPLATLLIYESVLVSRMAQHVNDGLSVSRLATGAQQSYWEFLSGMTDAADSGTVSARAVDALHATSMQLRELEEAQPSEQLRGAIDEVNRVAAAVRAGSALKDLSGVRNDVNGAAQAIGQTATSIESALGTQVSAERESSARLAVDALSSPEIASEPARPQLPSPASAPHDSAGAAA